MGTLETAHEQRLMQFDRERQQLPQKLETLERLKRDLQELQEASAKGSLNMAGHQLIARLQEQCANLAQEVERVQNEQTISQYFLKTGPILFEYFNQVQEHRPQEEEVKRDLRDFFRRPARIPGEDCLTTRRGGGEDPEDAAKRLFGEPDQEVLEADAPGSGGRRFRRADLYDQYLTRVDPHHIPRQTVTADQEYCPHCKAYSRYIDRLEAKSICRLCGTFENETLDSDKPSFHKDQPQELSSFAYKRINHFNEILNQFQAKENTEIPQEVYDAIITEMKKERKSNLADLDEKTVKRYLKKYSHRNYVKYYEHIPHIIHRLNGLPPKKLTPLQEENLRTLFKQIQPSFDRHCPMARNNFLSYHYTLYKLCELLCYDEFLECFNLLKSRNKQQDQEYIWKKICQDLQWQFIPTNT